MLPFGRDLSPQPDRRVGALWRALVATSALGFGAHSRDRFPTSKRCSETIGRAPTAPPTSSSTTPARPKTSLRKLFSPHCGASSVSTTVGRLVHGYTESSSTGRSTGL